jgi:branched-chain amino acid transport system ATP-binding protein
MLKLSNVSAGYGAIVALKHMNLDVQSGEITCVLGPNGAGKSTTMKTVLGFLRPFKGTVELDNTNLEHFPTHQRIAKGLGWVPEGRHIFPRMSVMENLEMGAFCNEDRAQFAANLDRVVTLFPVLKERFKQAGGTLSGGEQQMLAIGRALMSSPRLLCMDEPSMGLAPIVVESVFDTIQEINRQGVTILLVEQNALMALSIAHRAYVLVAGEIVLQGTAAELQADESVKKAYLGIK